MPVLIVTIFALSAASAFAASSTNFYVVALEVDWQLFMGLNAALDVPGADSKTVFVIRQAQEVGNGVPVDDATQIQCRAIHSLCRRHARHLETNALMPQTGLWAVTTSALTASYQLSTRDPGHNAFLGRQYFRILAGTVACTF